MNIVDKVLQRIGENERTVLWILFLVCALTRLLFLGDKPVMHDESLFGYYAEFQFHRDFTYLYLPILHGPLLLYLQGIVFFLFGASDYTMRLIPALAGIGGFLILAQMRSWLGCYGRLAVLLFYTFSAPLMYYQRFMRNDPLLIFLTLWSLLALMQFIKHRSRSSMVQFALAITLMLCTKESSVFYYFTLVTFGLLCLLHDTLHYPFIRSRVSLSNFTPQQFMGIGIAVLILFSAIVTVQTQVFEGITYDADVIQELGRNTSFAQMNSLQGLQEGDPKWVVYYALLFLFCSGAVSIVYYLAQIRFGKRELIRQAVDFVVREKFLILGTATGCFFIYWALFTTLFVHPENPFTIYRNTLSYWMGQNAVHRIEGPFHFHFVNLLVYELPLMLIATGVVLVSLWRTVPRTGVAVPTMLMVIFFLLMTVVCLLLPNVFSWLFLIPIFASAGFLLLILFYQKRDWLVRVFLFGLAAYFILFLLSPEWNAAFNYPLENPDPRILNYREFLDETISVSNSYHLLLIILPTIGVLYHVWSCLERKKRFEAFAFWWALTTFGAVSYAREKVPWVGIHTILPLLLIAGIYAERLLTSKHQMLKTVAAVFLVIGVGLGIKNSALLNVRYSSDVRERMVYGHSTRDLKNHVELVIELSKLGSPQFSHSVDLQYPTVEEQDWVLNYNKPGLNRMAQIYVGHDELNWPLYWYFRDLSMTTFETPESAVEKNFPFLFLTPTQAGSLPDLEEKYYVMRGRSRMHWTPFAANEDALWGVWRFGIPGYKRTPGTRLGMLTEETQKEWSGLLNYWWSRKVMEQPTPRFSVVEYVFAIHRDALSYERLQPINIIDEWNAQLEREGQPTESYDRNGEGRRRKEEPETTEPEPTKGGRFLDGDAMDQQDRQEDHSESDTSGS